MVTQQLDASIPPQMALGSPLGTAGPAVLYEAAAKGWGLQVTGDCRGQGPCPPATDHLVLLCDRASPWGDIAAGCPCTGPKNRALCCCCVWSSTPVCAPYTKCLHAPSQLVLPTAFWSRNNVQWREEGFGGWSVGYTQRCPTPKPLKH